MNYSYFDTSNFSKITDFVGARVFNAFLISVLIGIIWFLVDTSFIFVLQSFLLSIGLLKPEQTMLPTWLPNTPDVSVLLLIVFGIARAVAFMLKNYYANTTQFAFTHLMRTRLLSYGLRHASDISSKDLLSAFTEVTTQSGLVIFFSSLLANTLASAALFFFVGFRMAPTEMIIGIVCLAIFLLPIRFVTSKINLYGQGLLIEWTQVTDSLLKGLKNFFYLTLFHRVENEIQSGERSLERYERYIIKHTLVCGVAASLPLLLGVLILSFITYLSITYIKTEPIKLVSFFYIFIRLSQAASEANATFSQIRLNLPGFRNLMAWHEKLKFSDRQSKLPVSTFAKEPIQIELKNVAFQFEDRTKIIENFQMTVKQGQVLVIQGPSGSGKSTLLSLTLGILKPTKGEVLINGISSHDWQFNFENVLGYVGPEPYLISGTIFENLVFGLDTEDLPNESRIWEALKLMELDLIIDSMPCKLNEKLLDQAQLSTGQRQRLSFARALLRQPRLLILDEATANLDEETEYRIIERLTTMIPQMTTIIVSHKDSFNRIATDRIYLKK